MGLPDEQAGMKRWRGDRLFWNHIHENRDIFTHFKDPNLKLRQVSETITQDNNSLQQTLKTVQFDWIIFKEVVLGSAKQRRLRENKYFQTGEQMI